MHTKIEEAISAKCLPVLIDQSGNGRNQQEITKCQGIFLIFGLVFLLILSPIFQLTSQRTAHAQTYHQNMPLYSCGDVYIISHCYGEWSWLGTMQGSKTDIKMQPITCIGACANSGFLNYEMWLADNSGNYWVEAGVKNEAGYGVTFSFWADSRPGGGYTNHYMNGITEFGKDITFYIFSNGTNQFQVSKVRAGVNGCTSMCSADWTNYSTNNSIAPYKITIGSELAGNNGASSPRFDFTYNYWYRNGRWTPQGNGSPGSGFKTGNPPYAHWINNQAGGTTGGDLQVWCC